MPEHLRQRLSHPGRHLPSRLYRHRGSRQGPCVRCHADDRGEDEGGLRGLQHRYWSAGFRAGTGLCVRESERSTRPA